MRRSIVVAIAMSASGCGRFGFGSPAGDASGNLPPPADARITDAPVYMLEAGQCPPGYDARGSSCYRLVTSQATWFAAEATCEGDAVGAHLVIIGGSSEANLLESVYNEDIWIGVTDRLSEGDYLDVTNAPLSFFDWDAGDPDGASEDCLGFDSTAEILDLPCNDGGYFLCEYDGRVAVPSAYQ